MKFVRDSSHIAIVAAALVGLTPALAQDNSDWALDIRSAARLIAGSAPADVSQYRAAVQLTLDPGWHTYWRYPGDAGVPPRFDFSDSENLRTVKVQYPAPQIFHEDGGTSIGYDGQAIFPLRVTPRDPSKPVLLKAGIYYAVCEKLCVPASGHVELTLKPGQKSGFDQRLDKAEGEVPKPIDAQQVGLTAKRASGGAKPLVFVDVATAANIQLFAEGPTDEWALPIPKPAPGAPAGHRYFGFELDGLPPGVNPMGPLLLTFTIVGNGKPVETTIHLD